MTEIAAKGTLLQRVTTTIAQVMSISGPGLSVDMLESSHHSTPNFWRTKLAGFKTGGDVSLSILFDPAEVTHADGVGGLLDDLNSGNLTAYKIIFPDVGLSEYDFTAFVSSFEVSAPHEDTLTAEVTLTISGEPILTTP